MVRIAGCIRAMPSVRFAASIGGRSALACDPLSAVESHPSRGGAFPPRRPPPRTTQCSGLANKRSEMDRPFREPLIATVMRENQNDDRSRNA